MSELSDAAKLAESLLEEHGMDQDDDLRLLSRQLLRQKEEVDRLRKAIADQEGTSGLIQANLDSILKKHEEAIAKLKKYLLGVPACVDKVRPTMLLTEQRWRLMLAVIEAVQTYHPMHEWSGWPKE